MPFGFEAEYDNFEDCVDDNQDKDNPERYCGWLMQETESIENSGVGNMDNKKLVKPEQSEIKAIEEDGTGYVEGYASVFGVIDEDGEVVDKGAFKKTTRERVPKNAVKFVDFHNSLTSSEEILGVVEEAEEDEHGLWFKARLSKTERAQNVRTKIKEGILDSLSIGYDVIDDEMDREDGVRHLKELRLWEVSVVSWGANPEASVTQVKQPTGKQVLSVLENYKHELKEGRVLSQSNYSRIQSNVESIREAAQDLEALLDSAEPEESTHRGQESQKESDEPDQIHSEDMEKALTPLKELVADQKGEKIRNELEEFRKQLRGE